MTKDAHSQPTTQTQDLLYDADVPTLSHAERARTLLESVSVATLCTLSHDPAAYPYGSLITFSMDGNAPTFFISELIFCSKLIFCGMKFRFKIIFFC